VVYGIVLTTETSSKYLPANMAMENPLSSSGTLRCQQAFGDTCQAQIAKWGNWF
jgi:hypothetical protein